MLGKFPFEPALRLGGDWASEAAPAICAAWQDHAKRFNRGTLDVQALARARALERERKRLPQIAPQERILGADAWRIKPGLRTRLQNAAGHVRRLAGKPPSSAQATAATGRIEAIDKAYYDAEVESFLDALGIGGAERQKVLEGFKHAAAGGLHREIAALLATATIAVGSAALIVDPASVKTILTALRLPLQLLTSAAIVESGTRRFRTAALEDVITQGRADVPPDMKTSSNVLKASMAVLRHMRRVGRGVDKLEQAVARLARVEADESAAQTGQREQATRAARAAYARVCHQVMLAGDLKLSADAATAEFVGNQLNLTTGWLTSVLYFAGVGLGVLTPAAIDGAISGGIGVGIALAGLLGYGATQIAGADSDGLNKGKRGIVNLVKHLPGDAQRADIRRWGQAYEAFRRERRPPVLASAARRAEIRRAAADRLDHRLEQLAALPPAPQAPAPEAGAGVRNSGDSIRSIQATPAAASGGAAPDAEPTAGIDLDAVLASWRSPILLRLEAMERLLAGAVAGAQRGLLQRKRAGAPDRKMHAARAALKASLADLYHLETAKRQMRPPQGSHWPDDEACARAASSIALIANEDVHRLFGGNCKEQYRAMVRSRELVAGESERYALINAGASFLPIAVSTLICAADVPLAQQREQGNPDIPRYADHRLATAATVLAQPAAHINAGARTAFQQREMQRLLQVTARPEGTPALAVDGFPEAASDDEGPDWLDRMVAAMEQHSQVPEQIAFRASGQAGGEQETLGIPLHGTVDYHHARREQESWQRRLGMRAKTAGETVLVGLRHGAVAMTALQAQGMAALGMKRSRADRQRADDVLRQARSALARNAAAPAAPAPAARHGGGPGFTPIMPSSTAGAPGAT